MTTRKELIEERLKNFHDQTQQVLDYYQTQGVLTLIDGEQDIENVTQDILEALKK